jgi:hypothetical protein
MLPPSFVFVLHLYPVSVSPLPPVFPRPSVPPSDCVYYGHSLSIGYTPSLSGVSSPFSPLGNLTQDTDDILLFYFLNILASLQYIH